MLCGKFKFWIIKFIWSKLWLSLVFFVLWRMREQLDQIARGDRLADIHVHPSILGILDKTWFTVGWIAANDWHLDVSAAQYLANLDANLWPSHVRHAVVDQDEWVKGILFGPFQVLNQASLNLFNRFLTPEGWVCSSSLLKKHHSYHFYVQHLVIDNQNCVDWIYVWYYHFIWLIHNAHFIFSLFARQ